MYVCNASSQPLLYLQVHYLKSYSNAFALCVDEICCKRYVGPRSIWQRWDTKYTTCKNTVLVAPGNGYLPGVFAGVKTSLDYTLPYPYLVLNDLATKNVRNPKFHDVAMSQCLRRGASMHTYKHTCRPACDVIAPRVPKYTRATSCNLPKSVPQNMRQCALLGTSTHTKYLSRTKTSLHRHRHRHRPGESAHGCEMTQNAMADTLFADSLCDSTYIHTICHAQGTQDMSAWLNV
jgi:hypothetical protein